MNLHVEIRHLRYVIAVADELHFGRAAGKLNLSPPSLSKQIRQLESHVGYLLFNRNTRQIEMTPAGRAFVVEARGVLRQFDRTLEAAAAAGESNRNNIVVGYSPWIDPSILTALKDAEGDKLPKIILNSAYTASQIDQLLSGRIDVGLVILPVVAEGIVVAPLWRDSLEAALPEHHKLCDHHIVSLSDLLGEPTIWMAQSLHPALYEYLILSCRAIGITVNVAHEVSTFTEALSLVAARVGVTLVKAQTSQYLQHKGVDFRKISEPSLSIATGVASRGNPSPKVEAFVRALRNQLAHPVSRD